MTCGTEWCINPDDGEPDLDGTVFHSHMSQWSTVGGTELRLMQHRWIGPGGVTVEPVQVVIHSPCEFEGLDALGVVALREKLGDLLIDVMVPAA